MPEKINNLFEGIGSVIQIMPKLGSSNVGQDLDLSISDHEALSRDWYRVAKDFHDAYEHETKESHIDVESQQAK